MILNYDYIEKQDVEKIDLYHKPLIPKPILHKCKDKTIVCLNYNKPYNSKWNKMTDFHLLNIIKFLQNNAVKYVENLCVETRINEATQASCWFNGDMAAQTIDWEILDLHENGIDEENEYNSYLEKFKFKEYVKEAKSRNLIFDLKNPYKMDTEYYINQSDNLNI